MEAIHAVVPDYESDLNAVGGNRSAEDPDPRPWFEVHGLTEDEAAALVAATETHISDLEAGQ